MSVSTNYLRAMSEGITTVRKCQNVAGEVLIRFFPYYNDRGVKVVPDRIVIKTHEPVNLASFDGISIDRIKNSTLHAAVAAGRLEFVR